MIVMHLWKTDFGCNLRNDGLVLADGIHFTPPRCCLLLVFGIAVLQVGSPREVTHNTPQLWLWGTGSLDIWKQYSGDKELIVDISSIRCL